MAEGCLEGRATGGEEMVESRAGEKDGYSRAPQGIATLSRNRGSGSTQRLAFRVASGPSFFAWHC